jgi:hypothetical protein
MRDSLTFSEFISVVTGTLCASLAVVVTGCASDAIESDPPAYSAALQAGGSVAPSATQSADDAKQLVLGKAHGCSLDAAISGVLCWGDNRQGQTTVPGLSLPRFIAAGGDTSCAITRTGVRCWGDDANGLLRVPLTTNDAKLLAVGDAHACAATDHGIVCWGDDSKGQLHAPELEGVSVLAAGAHHSCALAANGVSCWGDSANGQLEVPQLTAPSALAVGGDHACAIDAGKVVCRARGPAAILSSIPDVVEPQLVATGASHACVLDKSGVHCWGDAVAGDLTPRELTLTRQLAVGGGDGWAHACARHLQGVACWGANNFGQAHYDGAPLHIVHASESRINASAEKVWQVIMDLESYPEWNPYTIHMESTLKVGDAMNMKVKMSELLTLDQTEYIRVLEPGHKVCWGINSDTPSFNSGERCQWLEPLPGGGTLWRNEDLIEGTANELVTALFGDDVQNGFDAVGVALKQRAESL